MKTKLVVLAFLGLFGSASHAADLTGVWRTIDDKTGIVRAHIKMEKQSDGSFTGTILTSFPAPGEAPLVVCFKCPPPYTNQPIIGMQAIKGLTEDPKAPNSFINGKGIDPRGGKTYSGKAKLSADGRKLRLRGYIGISMLGRSQTWIRGIDH